MDFYVLLGMLLGVVVWTPVVIWVLLCAKKPAAKKAPPEPEVRNDRPRHPCCCHPEYLFTDPPEDPNRSGLGPGWEP